MRLLQARPAAGRGGGGGRARERAAARQRHGVRVHGQSDLAGPDACVCCRLAQRLQEREEEEARARQQEETERCACIASHTVAGLRCRRVAGTSRNAADWKRVSAHIAFASKKTSHPKKMEPDAHCKHLGSTPPTHGTPLGPNCGCELICNPMFKAVPALLEAKNDHFGHKWAKWSNVAGLTCNPKGPFGGPGWLGLAKLVD